MSPSVSTTTGPDHAPLAMKSQHYRRHTAVLRAELAAALPKPLLRTLHRRSPLRHLAIALRQFLLVAAAGAAILASTNPLIWVPAAVVLGFTIFNFSVLLHEVVHHNVFATPRRRLERALALAYALPSGLSPTQFGRWHLDHHAELGSDESDPKRRHLSPKRNSRWVKLLYCTPALFPMYFRAARREASSYPNNVRRRIGLERIAVIGTHLGVLTALWWTFGGGAALRAYVVPVFFVFPVAFTLNRLGQHYDIDPADPVKWGTLLESHAVWNTIFLCSNLHLEHHYFPGVPFYNLPRLQLALQSFYRRHGVRPRTYRGLIWDWFGRNRAPHTRWD